MAVVKDRPKLKRCIASLQNIRRLAESCSRQLNGWAAAVDRFPFEGRRLLPERQRRAREVAQKGREFKLSFLRNLSPSHPLYNSAEARAARSERAG